MEEGVNVGQPTRHTMTKSKVQYRQSLTHPLLHIYTVLRRAQHSTQQSVSTTKTATKLQGVGGVQTLADPYHNRVPLPRIPNNRAQSSDFHPMSGEPLSVHHPRLNRTAQRTSRLARRHTQLSQLLDTHTNLMRLQ